MHSKEPEKSRSSARTKPKGKKQESPEDEPLLKLTPSEDLFFCDDFNRADESDALLLELASLDLGQASDCKPPSLNSFGGETQVSTNSETNAISLGDIFGEMSTGVDNQWSKFLPSQILGKELGNHSTLWQATAGAVEDPPSGLSKTSPKLQAMPGSKKVNTSYFPKTISNFPLLQNSGKDMSSWYNLFADLDPLSNPDSVTNTQKEDDRNC